MPIQNFAEEEKKILEYWNTHKVFELSVKNRPADNSYVFYDGPPFATGLPHYGHLLASTIKDVVPRYFTMKGQRVERRWGWDCHGLPIENIIEKKLGINSRKEIEELGVDKFCDECRNAIFVYDKEWERVIERLGRWVDFRNSYKTMDTTYIESVWWAFKTLFEKDLVYEGTRTALYCPRCETPLTNFEIAMDNSYRDIEDTSAYVKFHAGSVNVDGNVVPRFFLAWTTTPWTLPGNRALAVNGDEYYVEILCVKTNEVLVLAKKLLLRVIPYEADYTILKEYHGKDLEGETYTPVYPPVTKDNNAKNYKVYAADLVTMEDGTGIVHIAPAFGEVDHELGVAKGLTIANTIDQGGRFNDEVPEWKGRNVWEANLDVVKWLEDENKLFKKEPVHHSYPFCYRCDTKLLFYTQKAWYIAVSKLRDRLLKHNESINWFPEHLKHGRFAKGIETAPDWCISRSRYWGSPMPVWACDTCDKKEIVGSIDELMEKPQENFITKITFIRHGQTDWNKQGLKQGATDIPLNDAGIEQVKTIAETLRGKKFTALYSSPLTRCKQTTKIICEVTGLSPVFDENITNGSAGDFEGKTKAEQKAMKEAGTFNNGESVEDFTKRLKLFFKKIAERHHGESIIVVTHGEIFAQLVALAEGGTKEDIMKGARMIQPAQAKTEYVYATDTSVQLMDLHRPFIDNVTYSCSCGGTMHRIPEVFDCWMESGSMPFAAQHYPFENKQKFEDNFPAEFISEYIAQTRAWFYVMHVLSVALFDKPAFKNCLTTGTILAEDGTKMSKRKNNYPDPEKLFEKYGVDALRLYLMSSSVMQAESVSFSEKEVDELYKKVSMLLWNVLTFWETYTPNEEKTGALEKIKPSQDHILDQWILARLEELRAKVTEKMDEYDVTHATKPLIGFIADLSQWYVRRSRDRMKPRSPEDEGYKDAVVARATLRYVLGKLSHILAPFMPFLAERVYKAVGGSLTSVHLADWPMKEKKHANEDVLNKMEATQKIIELGLSLRAETKIKVRQPLSKLEVQTIDLADELLPLIEDELNVKEVTMVKKVSVGPEVSIKKEGTFTVGLHTAITPELEQEGFVREVVRTVNGLRKESRLTLNDHIVLHVEAPTELQTFFKAHTDAICGSILATGVRYDKKDDLPHTEVNLGAATVWLGIEKQ